MKKIFLYTLILFLGTTLSANAQKEMDKFMVQVDGLGCPFCAYGLEKKFKEFKGIKKVKIDIETGDFSFSYPSEKALTLEAVAQQVEKAGYTPNEAKVERANGEVETFGSNVAETKNSGDFVTHETRVAGNCGMCEARIIKAAKSVPGVAMASWDKDTKIMSVSFNAESTSLDAVQKAVALAGHDTENYKAEEGTYNNLPACCHYERIQ